MPGVGHYNAHAYRRPAWIRYQDKRHKPPVSPMDVAFLVPEASQKCSRCWLDNLESGRSWPRRFGAFMDTPDLCDPECVLALRLVAPRQDPGARALIRAAYFGELGKLGLTVLMFSAVFVLVQPLSPAALFAGFIAAQLVTFAGFLLRDKTTTEETTSNNNG